MKNILKSVAILCFISIVTSIHAQSHLSPIRKLRPCQLNQDYILYLQADAPTTACYGNSIQIISSAAYATIHDCGTGVGAGFAQKNDDSPTGWAYCIKVEGSNGNRPIQIRELVYTPNCAAFSHYNTRRISATVRRRPTPITDIELESTSLCGGLILARAKDAFSSTHDSYTWYYNGSAVPNGTTEPDLLLLQTGQNINSNFTIGVTAINTCGTINYTETFTVDNPPYMARPRIVVPSLYCAGKNTFTINHVTPGIEYKWQFIPLTTHSTPSTLPIPIPKQGLEMTSYTPDFGRKANTITTGDVIDYQIKLYFRTNCSAGWVLSEDIIVNGISYNACYNNRAAHQTVNAMSNGGHSVEGGATNNNTNPSNSNNSPLSTLKDGTRLTASPNPTTGFVELNSGGKIVEAVFVYDVTGILVSQQLNNPTTNPTIDLSDLPKGMYLVKVQTATTSKTIQVAKQ
ncbi:MAG: T9SS type A sorting domain-containing protein [Aureispira sp.]